MTDLVTFLRARLDEDEAIANAARHSKEGRWQRGTTPDKEGRVYADCGVFSVSDEPIDTSGWRFDNDYVVYDEGAPSEEEAEHIARHDPARVLREVAAKRAILDARRQQIELDDPEVWIAGDVLLFTLAAVYADHPDFDPAWKVGE